MRTNGARVCVPALLICLILSVGLALAPAALGANRFEPANGRIYSGVTAEWPATKVAAFATMTGQPGIAIASSFTGGYLEPLSTTLNDLKQANSAAMVSWKLLAGSSTAAGGTHQSVSQGAIDAYLVSSATTVRGYGRPVFLRPNWEMTGNWYPWSTYDRNGRQRSGNSAYLFRKAWQRARIIFDGGTRSYVNSRLSSLNLPGLKVSNTSLTPVTNAAWVWSVSMGGVKPQNGLHKTSDYYPGDAYVDWVGTTMDQYGTQTFSYWSSTISVAKDPLARTNNLYTEYSVNHGKPFMFGEWAVSGAPYGSGDNPTWINDVFSWMQARPKAKAQVYFNRKPSHSHLLQEFPQSKAAFSSRVKSAASIYDWHAIPTG